MDNSLWKKIKLLAPTFFGPIAALIFYSSTTQLEPQVRTMAAIIVLVVLWWIFSAFPLPITGLFGVSLCVITDLAPLQEAFANFAHPLIFLFMGGFFIAKALEVHGIDQKVALRLMSLPWCQKSNIYSLLSLLGLTSFFSMWISNTAATAIMVPIALSILNRIPGVNNSLRGTVLLSVAYAATIGGIITPIGSAPNIIALGMLDKLQLAKISFLEWMLMAFPIAITVFFFLAILVRYAIKQIPAPKQNDGQGANLVAINQDIKFSKSDFIVLSIIGLTIIGWLLPSVFKLLFAQAPFTHWLQNNLSEPLVAVVGSSLLFFIPYNGRELILNWEKAKHIDWGTLLLFGSGLALGSIMFKTGLAETIGQGFVSIFGTGAQWPFLIGMIGFTIFFTELTSNTASGNLMIPIVISVTQQLQLDPVIPTIMVAISASMAFMLPVATPPNAIVYGTGLVPMKKMIKKGYALSLYCIVLLSTVAIIFS